MKTNKKAVAHSTSLVTHEGGPAAVNNAERDLRRAVLACLLWEDSFYESGESIADRIHLLANKVPVEVVSRLAAETRTEYNLRHAALWLALSLVYNGAKGKIVGDTIYNVIRRADELAEMLSLYWSKGRKPLSNQLKRGLAKAFTKFDAYALAKYNRDGAVKLRDVLFMTHAKPKNEAQAAVWKQLVEGTLPPPDTWEVALSAGGDKKEVFTRLLKEKQLGYLALLRNLRNMDDAGVDRDLVESALIDGAPFSKALPFNFVSAANAAPIFSDTLEKAMFASLARMNKLPGRTAVIVDASESMQTGLSNKGKVTRADAAAALAMMAKEVCEKCDVYAFGTHCMFLPQARGFNIPLIVKASPVGFNTYAGKAVTFAKSKSNYDRMLIITDEQSADKLPNPDGKGYILNVASYKNGIAYGPWISISGFSEATVRYITEVEKLK